jgi:subtilase family serine protease
MIGALALVTQAGASTQSMVTVEHAGAAPAGSTDLGAVAANASQTGDVVLKPRDPAALKAFVAAVTTKGSSSYHHYLAGGAFAAKFGPTQATINAVESTLKGAGLTVTGVSSNGELVGFSGDTAQVESAFSTKLENYKTSAGVTAEETTAAIKLPSSVSSQVTAVIGLDNVLKQHDFLTRGTQAAEANFPKAKTAKITNYPAGSPTPTVPSASTPPTTRVPACTSASTSSSRSSRATWRPLTSATSAPARARPWSTIS